jgi:hypothetical protein
VAKSKDQRTNRRRRILVDQSLQLRLIRRVFVTFVVAALIFIFVTVAAPAFFSLLPGARNWGVDQGTYRLRQLTSFVVLPLLSAGFLAFGQALRETFKIAGPIYRFRKVFEDLAAFRVPRGVRVRSADYLQEAAAELDGSLVKMHDQIETLQVEVGELLAAVGRLEQVNPQSTAVQHVRVAADTVQRSAGRFLLLPTAPYDPSKVPADRDPKPAEPPLASSVP